MSADSAPIYTYERARFVPADAADVRAAVDRVVARLWSSHARLVEQDDLRRTDAVALVAGSPEADVWVTWHLQRLEHGTRVRIVLEEVERGPDPGAGLERLLDELASTASVATS